MDTVRGNGFDSRPRRLFLSLVNRVNREVRSGRVRVLVVEDSATVRRAIVEVLRSAPDLEVVGEAVNGLEGIRLCQELRPDVVTLDMMMPVMNGLAATEHIMAHCPTPILVLSASTNRGEAFNTYDALAAGAVDVMEKPLGALDDGTWSARLLSTVRLVSRIPVITHPRGKRAPAPQQGTITTPVPAAANAHQLVVLGASTGGPNALAGVLRGMPPDFPLPILFVLHIGAPFGASFAEWLDHHTPLRVQVAEDGQPLPRPGQGRVIMAPPDFHMVVRGGRIWLNQGPERHSCRPSVDVLFESVAREIGGGTIGCLLTGMGRDGASGLLAIRRAGGVTMAQDEATSVVYGMPREAIANGGAERALPLGEIAPALVKLARGGDRGGK